MVTLSCPIASCTNLILPVRSNRSVPNVWRALKSTRSLGIPTRPRSSPNCLRGQSSGCATPSCAWSETPTHSSSLAADAQCRLHAITQRHVACRLVGLPLLHEDEALVQRMCAHSRRTISSGRIPASKTIMAMSGAAARPGKASPAPSGERRLPCAGAPCAAVSVAPP